ncbi:WD40 repeat domain-containing protein [Archangium sp.]|uniref:WD40 repeat domain-containing protein n=1 Tax=Archangium sp. TaxID=1872627 RepID=UPI002D237CC8|nr:WD40 repeat domain-containing protein [Archangium sp.]HYO52888.1 WD40 repeat domain-containing protein [Archangium sp.]
MKHIGPISGIAAYKDTYVATAGYDNQVILWRGSDRTALARVHHDHLANQCAFSPCGRYLVSSSSDFSARIWELPSLRLRAVLSPHEDDVEMSVFSEGGDRVATCSRDHTIRVFSLDGKLQARLQGHQADVISVSWEQGSSRLISSSDDGTIRRWDTETGALLETVDLNGVETDTIALAEDGTVFAGNDNGELLLIRKGDVSHIPAHAAGIKRLTYSAGQLVSLSYDRSVMIWSFSNGKLKRLRVSDLPSIVWPRSCAFFGSSQLVFGTFGSTYATYDYVKNVWDTSGIEPDISLNAVTHAKGSTYAIGDAGIVYRDGQKSSSLGSLCNFLLPFGDSVLTGGQMGEVFDGVRGKSIYHHRSPLNCGATFTRNGVPHAIIGAYTGEGLVFRQEGDAIVHVATVSLHENAIKGVACSGDTIFSVCATGAAAFHRIGDFGLVRRVDKAHERIANGCVALRDGRFASISRDRKLRLWHEGEATVFSSPHLNSIKCIAASADGRWLATGDYAGTLGLFDIERQKWARVIRPTASGISSVAPAPQPGTFTASSYDGQLYTVSGP